MFAFRFGYPYGAATAAPANGSITLGGSANWSAPAISGGISLGGGASAKAAVSTGGSLSLGGSVAAKALLTGSPVTNLFDNDTSKFTTSTGFWSGQTGITSITRLGATSHGGGPLGILEIVNSATVGTVLADLAFGNDDWFTGNDGQSYTFKFYMYASSISHLADITPKISWYDSGLAFVSTSTGTVVRTTVSPGWTEVSVTATCPAGAFWANPHFTIDYGSGGAGEVHYLDDARFGLTNPTTGPGGSITLGGSVAASASVLPGTFFHGTDADFESGVGVWSGSGYGTFTTTSNGRTGVSAATLTADGTFDHFFRTPPFSRQYRVIPGSSITMRGWVRAPSASRSAFAAMFFQKVDTTATATGGGYGTLVPTTSSWQEVVYTQTVPGDAYWVEFRYGVGSPANGEVFYIDDLSAVMTPHPGAS
jgi:hypothetical protein